MQLHLPYWDTFNMGVSRKKHLVIIDGNNIAWSNLDDNGRPQLKNIKLARESVLKKGYTPITIVASSLKYDIDEKTSLEELSQKETVLFSPDSVDRTTFIVNTAEEYKAPVVTNDNSEKFQKVKNLLARYNINKDRMKIAWPK